MLPWMSKDRAKKRDKKTTREILPREVCSCMCMNSIGKGCSKCVLLFIILLNTHPRLKKPILAHMGKITVSTQNVGVCTQCLPGFPEILAVC